MKPESQLLQNRIFNIINHADFLEIALTVFNYQYENNAIYHQFVHSLGKISSQIDSLQKIPFLPVEFFRNHQVVTGDLPVEVVFESSGTTGTIPGKHFVSDRSLYEESFLKSFRLFYGNPEDYLIAALLPSYTERSGSSLVYMAGHLIKKSKNTGSGFYKDNTGELLTGN